ncbi:MAG TPA: nitrogenase cofactor biosynthesis protein NifB [Treponemataceae bacterium]|nr:nitrogenase cofactor biosynthesis protein NifB [Treponemataceae bacterium]HPS44890.1 nitrogenase cofactor biosynthesis protein NifB [Treponemataceae bacterium]
MDFENHPCFSAEARHKTARIHLPVAPKCNVQCNFCNRKYDCVNESRPGVCSAILSPEQSVDYLSKVMETIGNVSVVGIAGPGDPFANPEATLRTMELTRARYPDMILCVATNGLGLPEYVDRVAKIGASHVTITLNAVDPAIGAEIYAWVRCGPHAYRGIDGARVLLERQVESIRALKRAGITVKINTVVIPGVNDAHVADVARYAAALGADVQNCIPLMHVENTAFAGTPTPDAAAMMAIRLDAGQSIKQMSHCARCRADAAGLVGDENSPEVMRLLSQSARIGPNGARTRVAVASREGLLVNQHLGEATGLWVFEMVSDEIRLIARRPTPAPGGGDARWAALAESIPDCFAVLAGGCGPAPLRVLAERGIAALAMEGMIMDGLKPLFSGDEIPRILTGSAGTCGAGISCGGTGAGCA